MRILIAGCGYVGTTLATRLAADGEEVFGLRRDPRGLPSGVAPVAADLTDPESLRTLPGSLDRIVYAASAGGGDEASYRAAYVVGVRNLIQALERGGQRPRFLFVSSTGVFAQSGGEWVDESSATEPADWRGRILLEGERLASGGPFAATVVRFGGIYGPGRTRLVARVRSGQATFRPGHYTNRIHRDDCAGVLRRLARLDDPEPLYLGVDCEPALERDVLGWIADRLGAPAPRAAAGTDARGRGSKRCRNARLLAAGYRFRFPTYREGYGELLRGFA